MQYTQDWGSELKADISFGFLTSHFPGQGVFAPKLVLNRDGFTVEHTIVDELKRSEAFTFSVAFITSGAIAQLKQRLLDFEGTGRIITSNYLSFNHPDTFRELLNLEYLKGIEVRRYTGPSFHPKGYIFSTRNTTTAMVGSSNLTNRALSSNHEWNLKVSASNDSDLARQIEKLLQEQIADSEPLTASWINEYGRTYAERPHSIETRVLIAPNGPGAEEIKANSMQEEALKALDSVRLKGAKRAIIISATGTGKTILSALDVRQVEPRRMLFVVHREQILDRTISEYRRVLGGGADQYGKLTGEHKEYNRRYVFATIQTLSQEATLGLFDREAFDYIIIDEAHRAAAETYRRALAYFSPKFLLGMTATPERTDGFNVFELFDHNVAYEIRLAEALRAEMLSPFHYYGVSDITFEDGTTTSDTTELAKLVSGERVVHLLQAIEKYAQAGTRPRGLIFCSRREEARALSELLNEVEFRGAPLRTVAVTGDDSVQHRERVVIDLESGHLDYILTVDVFNEGIDIPSINQVIMMRQTQSPIIFVQQLGRGLRLAAGKDHLVVIDFIGNYKNNFMIPIALFGDSSLNKEIVREKLHETSEAGALPGLSSISFDKVARERILESVRKTQLDGLAAIRSALVAMQNRVGRLPELRDFHNFASVDPILLATKKDHFPALVESLLGVEHRLSLRENKFLSFFSHEVMGVKRMHEFLLFELLVARKQISVREIQEEFRLAGLPSDSSALFSAVDTLLLHGFSTGANKKYGSGIAERYGNELRVSDEFLTLLSSSDSFARAVWDVIETGKALTQDRYSVHNLFTPGMQYTRADAARLLGWPRKVASTIYGVKTDTALGVAAIFVTLEKAEGLAASTAYQDALLSPSLMRWFSKSNRTTRSSDVAPIVSGQVQLHVFVKKDDAEGGSHYYLGRATAEDIEDTTMPVGNGRNLPVVTMILRFEIPVKFGLFSHLSGYGAA